MKLDVQFRVLVSESTEYTKPINKQTSSKVSGKDVYTYYIGYLYLLYSSYFIRNITNPR